MDCTKNLKVIENANVVLERGIIWDGVIVAENGQIVSFGKRGEVEIPIGAARIDAKGAYVGPGLVDIHVHGGGGYNFATDLPDAAKHFLRHGETSMLASTSQTGTFTRDELVEIITDMRRKMPLAPNVKGIYMEGPYFNGNYGANSHLNVWKDKAVLPEDFMPMVDAGGTDVKAWMVAPERPDLLPFMQYARKVNPEVRFSFGHSEAAPWEIRRLGKYSPTIQTHSMNATGKRFGKGGIRPFGPDEYAFVEPDVYCEMISDSQGIHVNSELQQMLLHVKGVKRVILITDCTNYNNPVPEKFAHVTDLNFDPRGGIAGSKLTLDMACRNVMSHTNCGIAEAFIMASSNPARAIGMDDEIGSIEIGKRCDLIFVDDMFTVKEVMMSGELLDL